MGKNFLNFLSEPDVSKTVHIFTKTMQGEAVEGIELKMALKHGGEIYIEANSIPIQVKGKVIGIQGIFRDITTRKQAEIELQHMATHDYLTDLPNIRLFLEHLDKALARARRSGEHVALLYLDLDGFKSVNDKFGHAIGDEVLRMVAKRLEESVRKADIVSRLGGDEFAILMTDLPYLNNVELARRPVAPIHACAIRGAKFRNLCHRQHRHQHLPSGHRGFRCPDPLRRPGDVLFQIIGEELLLPLQRSKQKQYLNKLIRKTAAGTA